MQKKSNIKTRLIASCLALLMMLSALVGTTFAWFTDSVTSSGNKIVSGTLKVDLELYDTKTQTWNSIKASKAPIFNYDNWEPGYTDVKLLKVENEGSLALKWKAKFVSDVALSELANVIDVYVCPSKTELTYPADRSLNGYEKVGTVAQFVNTIEQTTYGNLLAGEVAYLGIALKMQESAGNEYQNKALGAFDIQIVATQMAYEGDSFGPDYDNGALYPLTPGKLYSATAAVTANAEGKVDADVTIGNAGDKGNATVPAGVLLEQGTKELTLDLSVVSDYEAVISAKGGDVIYPLDIHVAGVSKDNTVPVIITLNDVFPKNYMSYNIKLVHVENGASVAMTPVDTLAELDAHNEFYYDPATGAVTVAMATFSEVTATVAADDPWNGTAVDTSWYNTTATEFTLTTADQLAGFAQIVGGMAEGIKRDSFAGKTVKLGADVNLGSTTGTEEKPVIFTPVGYYFNENYEFENGTTGVYSDVFSFEGTFDGQGHVVSNILQRTWDIKGDDPHYDLSKNHYYNDGMGLFGFVYNGTVKNLVIDNFQSDGEFCTTGCVAAYSAGVSTFENIRIINSNPRAYNVPNGGVVGYAYDEAEAEINSITFNNIIVDASTKVTALWGSWDVGCGGVLGRMGDSTKVTMTNCTVAAEIDVFNDVCGNYQYYQFRYCGMLIGTCGSDEDPSDQIKNVTFADCHVRYGDWADHYYCELVANSKASYTHDYQFSRLDKIESMTEIKNGDAWLKAGNFVYNNNGKLECYHIVNDNGTLKQHLHTDSGEEVIDGKTVLVEDNQIVAITFNQLYTGYGWGSAPSAEGVGVADYIYSITYMYGGKVYDIVYVTKNDEEQSTANEALEEKIANDPNKPADYVFDCWVNAGGKKVESLAAGNVESITVYPSWKNIYTARWVDENGNVIHEQHFNTSTETLDTVAGPASATDALVFDHWEVRKADGTSTPLNDYELQNATGDITIYPYYNVVTDGSQSLGITGVDVDGDGKIDHYTIEAVDAENISTDVEIPGYINGVPVKVITDLSGGWASNVQNVVIKEGVEEINAGAFGDTASLQTVELPSTITTIGESAFMGNIGNIGSSIGIYKKPLHITYNGTMEQWENVDKADGWDSGLGSTWWSNDTATVTCSDGVYKMENGSWVAYPNPTT